MTTKSEQVNVTQYLFKRLRQVGVKSIHGVPGDYNLHALDYLADADILWVGSVNELNAGYAADGYARVHGISALVTTFGVGELSAINAIAGAYSEHIPIVHIVGCPSLSQQREKTLLHHTLGNGDFNAFVKMNSSMTCKIAKLENPNVIPGQIDDCIRECFLKARPVYIMLPMDMVKKPVDGTKLQTKLDLEPPDNHEEAEDYVVDVVLRSIYAAKNSAVLVDACAVRHHVLSEVHDFIEKTNLPVFVTPMGKAGVNETIPQYSGVYAGDGSDAEVKKRLESSDLILCFGGVKSDFNTAGFSYHTSQLQSIDFHSDHVKVRYSEYPGIGMRGVLRKVIKQVDPAKVNVVPGPQVNINLDKYKDGDETIVHEWLWPRISFFLREKDIIVTETGTANFGIWSTKFPANVKALNQVLWGSIGWSVGAAQGAALAQKDQEHGGRTILFVGDGSFQLTAQEISTMMRHELKPIIFLINNDGFTIERLIHGMNAKYNDIIGWDYTALVDVFAGVKCGDKNPLAKKFQVKTKKELDALLSDEQFAKCEDLQFVEIFMPKKDAPKSLILITEQNSKDDEDA